MRWQMTRTTASADGRPLPALIQLDQSRNEMDRSVLRREKGRQKRLSVLQSAVKHTHRNSVAVWRQCARMRVKRCKCKQLQLESELIFPRRVRMKGKEKGSDCDGHRREKTISAVKSNCIKECAVLSPSLLVRSKCAEAVSV